MEFKATTRLERLLCSRKVTAMNLNYLGVRHRAVTGHHCAISLLQCSHTYETRVALERGKKDIKCSKGEELRWQKNRTGRPLSPPRIHQKIIWTLSKHHKQLLITSRGHQTPEKQPISMKGGRTKYKRWKRDNRVRDRDLSWEGSLNRGSFQTPGNPLTGGPGGSFQFLGGQPNWEEK